MRSAGQKGVKSEADGGALAQGVLRAAGQRWWGDGPQLYGGHELERDWAQGLPARTPLPKGRGWMCAPQGGASN